VHFPNEVFRRGQKAENPIKLNGMNGVLTVSQPFAARRGPRPVDSDLDLPWRLGREGNTASGVFVLGALPLQQLFSRLRREFDATEYASGLRDVCYLFGLYALVHLFAMHGYTLRCREAEAQLITLYGEHSDGDVIADLY